jgi:hypothetical protein
VNPDPDSESKEGKKDPQKWEKVKKFHVLKFWMLSFKG